MVLMVCGDAAILPARAGRGLFFGLWPAGEMEADKRDR